MKPLHLIAGAFFSVASVSQAADPLPANAGSEPTASRWAIGTRIVDHILLVDHRDASATYLGHLGRMEAQEDFRPVGLFARYRTGKDWDVELAWDRVSAEVFNVGSGTHDPDGELSLQGPQVTATYHLPVTAGFEPYFGAGFAYMLSSFDHALWHHLGYASEADWESVGAPREYRNGKHRWFKFDDSFGWLVEGGADYHFNARWSLNLDVRLNRVSVDGRFYESLGGNPRRVSSGSFPFDNVSLGAGLLYHF